MYAGFWRRFFAFLIDAFIVFVIYILAFVGLIFAFMKGGSDYMRNMYFLAFYLFTFALNILYWTLFECSSWQWTISIPSMWTSGTGKRLSPETTATWTILS